MYTAIDHPVPKATFEDLASAHGKNLISIYLPMDKNGKEQNRHIAQATLKHCIKEVEKTLKAHQYSKEESKNYLKPIQQLIDRIDLWRHPSDGLALFLNEKELTFYTVPIAFETQTYVANHFYLKPLLPLYVDNGRYYVLGLSLDYLKLYEASKFVFKDVYVEDFAPDQIEKAVGYDFKPKMLQFRSGQATHGAASFHGHGEGKDDDKKEILNYLKAVDRGIKQVITDRDAPLMLACVDKLYPLYKQSNSYPNLYETIISGNPELIQKDELHHQSWELIKPYFEKIRRNKLFQFTELYNTPKTTYTLSDTISAAFNGKIESLFIEEQKDMFGVYDPTTKHITIDEQKKINNASLFNLIALQTIMQGGKVYVLKPEDMPLKGEAICALLRY